MNTKFLRGVKCFVTKHGSEILTGIGIAGAITTTILAVKATPKALRLMDEEIQSRLSKKTKDKDENVEGLVRVHDGDGHYRLTAVDAVKCSWKCYVPATVTGVLSIACLIGAQTVSARRTAALAAAYKLSEKALSEFKDAAVEVIGDEKLKEVKKKVAKKKVDAATSDDNNAKVIITGDGDAWFIDPFSNTKFQSSINKIDAAINTLNRNMRDEMFISLSQFYDEIGLEHTATSDDLGWNMDKGYIDIDYSDAVVKDGKAYIVLDFTIQPMYDFDRCY